MGSNFEFVKQPVLRQNLDEAFNHMLTLLPFLESAAYNEVAKSAFRKTIIIYNASIIEALLFHVLDCHFSDDDVKQFYESWEFKAKCLLHEVDASHKIVAGDLKKIPSRLGKEKLNLKQITDFLKAKGILKDDLLKKIDEIRELRNDQHIGPHTKVKTYSKSDLENAFSVANEVKNFSSNNCP
jgi:hypothetical protein